MQTFKLKHLFFLYLIAQLQSCTMLQHGDDPNYTLCKTLENKLVFRDNSTLFSTNPTSTYEQTAAEADDEERDRIQATYDKMDCQRYQAFRF